MLVVGISLITALDIIRATNWQNTLSILTTVGYLTVLIILALVAVGIFFWILKSRRIEQEEQKQQVNQQAIMDKTMSLKKQVAIGSAFAVLFILISFSVKTLTRRPDPRVTEPLMTALDGVDRIQVRTGGTCHHHLYELKPLFNETDPNTIATVIRKIALAKLSGVGCECCGNPSFEFYKGDELIATISLHHGIRLRWPEVWPSDAKLPRETKSFIRRWFATNNFDLDQIGQYAPLHPRFQKLRKSSSEKQTKQ